MTVRARLADPACFELADHFLADSPEAWRGMHRQELAFAIQQAVEDYFTVNETVGPDETSSPPPTPVDGAQ